MIAPNEQTGNPVGADVIVPLALLSTFVDERSGTRLERWGAFDLSSVLWTASAVVNVTTTRGVAQVNVKDIRLVTSEEQNAAQASPEIVLAVLQKALYAVREAAKDMIRKAEEEARKRQIGNVPPGLRIAR